MNEEGAPEWIRRGEAAKLAGVHPNTIRNWGEAGLIAWHRPDGHHMTRRSDVLRVARERNRQAAAREEARDAVDAAHAAHMGLDRRVGILERQVHDMRGDLERLRVVVLRLPMFRNWYAEVPEDETAE
jgi:DNA-binding transcriptional MerR regulator